MRYTNQTIMYNDTMDMPALQDTAPLGNTPLNHSIPEHNDAASAEYSMDPNPHYDIA